MGVLLNVDYEGPKWTPPADYAPQIRSTKRISGIAQFLEYASALKQPPYTHTHTKLQQQLKDRIDKTQKQEKGQREQFQKWKSGLSSLPGNPASTIILARLNYTTTLEDISRALEQFGKIQRITIVEDKINKKPRGYAFVQFMDVESASAALKKTGGEVVICGNRVIMDLERARVQRDWKPRRLGGGIGGRFTVARSKAENARRENILRYGLHIGNNNHFNNHHNRMNMRNTSYKRNYDEFNNYNDNYGNRGHGKDNSSSSNSSSHHHPRLSDRRYGKEGRGGGTAGREGYTDGNSGRQLRQY